VIILGSANAGVGIEAGWDVIAGGGTALDAVEVAIRLVEDNPEDHTVGYAGYPNQVGEVELDASLIDGHMRRAGAVGALKNHRHAITVARAVLERLPHVLVVGDGAARLAAELGMEPETLLTPETERFWREGVAGGKAVALDPEHAAGTVDVMAIDGGGHIASGVSTSGWAFKYPGRLGDSPIVGAGNYADDRYGAAACTGWGELAIRAATAHSVVLWMADGVSVEDACVRGLRDLVRLGVPTKDVIMQIVAVDSAGNHCAVAAGRSSDYVLRTEGMVAFETRPRVIVDLDA
jgi:beta-aspartyl-peptidase (threonine type)